MSIEPTIAYLFLAEYDNLEILRNVGPQFNFDFLVNIKSNSNIIGKFGLELKAKKRIEPKSIHLEIKLKNLIPIQPIPILLFFIDITSKQYLFRLVKRDISRKRKLLLEIIIIIQN